MELYLSLCLWTDNIIDHWNGTGVRKIMLEAVKKPLLMRKSGVCALFYYAMRGTSSRFHSRAEKVLRLLMDSSIVGIGDEFTQGKQSLKRLIYFILLLLFFNSEGSFRCYAAQL